MAVLLLCHILLIIIAHMYEGRYLYINVSSIKSSGLTQFDILNFKELGVFNFIMPVFSLTVLTYLIVRLIQHFRWKLIPLTLMYLTTSCINICAVLRNFFDMWQFDLCMKLNNIIISAPTGHGCNGYSLCLVYLLLLIVSFSLLAIPSKEESPDDIEIGISHIFNVKTLSDPK